MTDSATRSSITPEPSRPKLRTRLIWIAAVSGLGLAAVAGAMVSGPAATADATEATDPLAAGAVTVIVQRPLFEADLTTRRFVAVVTPRIETPYAFQVTGQVEARLVENGEVVKAGAPLVRLIRADFELARVQAQAEAAAAEEALRVGREDARRIESLRASGAAAVAALDNANRALREAEARLDSARAQLELADNRLGYTTLTAEADGIVISPKIEVGQVIAAGTPVLTLAQMGSLEVEVALPEGLTLPRIGAEASFLPWAEPGVGIPARLRELSPTADARTHTFPARFALEEGAALRLGSTGHLALPVEAEGGNLVRVPGQAIYDPGTSTGPGLWRVDAQTRLEFVAVRVARLDGTDALVEAPLGPQDRIVALGANRLKAGLVVNVLERAPE